MATTEKNERADKLRALAGDIRGQFHDREAIAAGFELIAQALEDSSEAKPQATKPAAKKTTAKKGA